jgi:hypothetical protein
MRFCAVPGDQLIGDVVEIVFDDSGLRSDSQYIVPGPPDECAFPPRRDRAERVPGMAGDQAELRGSTPSSRSTWA